MSSKPSMTQRFKQAWDVFRDRADKPESEFSSNYNITYGGSTQRPDRIRLTMRHERSIITSIFNRITLDAASFDIKHVKLDDNNRYVNDVNSDLDRCLSLSANIDQTGRALVQDIVMSMLDEGCVAVVPVITDRDYTDGSFKIYSLRVGEILEWYPDRVRVEVYDERAGERKRIIVPKDSVAIIENPFYSVVNEPNSTLQRLIRKMNLLDCIDEQSGSGKMDLIIQLPYAVKGETKIKMAKERRKDIEDQLVNSKYGIAYIDGTEHITQLNRPVENNLMGQIEYLTNLLFSQLGLTQTILDGTANAEAIHNYYTRTIEVILSVITEEMKRKFLSQTAITEKQSIMFFRNPFKLIPVTQLADLADKMTRNEIMSSNEFRQVMGMKPSNDPRADELINKNLRYKEDKATDSEPVVQTGNENNETIE